MKTPPLRQLVILAVLFSTMLNLPGLGQAVAFLPQPLAILAASFAWTPVIVIIGNTVSFTAVPSGGTSPYSFSWDFGDGQTGTGNLTQHRYTVAGSFSVTLNVTDSAVPVASVTVTRTLTVLPWPTIWNGWVVHWNITGLDGLVIWNITFQNKLVIRDARLPGIVVRYKDYPATPCFFYDEFISAFTDVALFEYSPAGSPDPWLQIRTMSVNRGFSLVGGYWYQQVWKFYSSGRWDAEVRIDDGGGCQFDHLYEAHWRIDTALAGDSREFMSTYTPNGVWRNLFWEGDYTDNGFRDPYHNGTQWRVGGNWTYYYLAPSITQTRRDLPSNPSKLILVRSKANEIEATHVPLTETPLRWVNPGELAFDRNIAIWFIGNVWVHAPQFHGGPTNTITLSFYPYGP